MNYELFRYLSLLLLSDLFLVHEAAICSRGWAHPAPGCSANKKLWTLIILQDQTNTNYKTTLENFYVPVMDKQAIFVNIFLTKPHIITCFCAVIHGKCLYREKGLCKVLVKCWKCNLREEFPNIFGVPLNVNSMFFLYDTSLRYTDFILTRGQLP